MPSKNLALSCFPLFAVTYKGAAYAYTRWLKKAVATTAAVMVSNVRQHVSSVSLSLITRI